MLGVSPRRGQGRGRRARPAALPLPRRHQRPRPARADDEHHQRRRARRQLRRPAGVHDRAGRRGRRFSEALRWGAETFHTLKALLHEQGPQHRARRRGRLRARPAGSNEEALDPRRGHREGRLQAGRATSRSRSTPPPASSTATATYQLAGEGRTLDAAGLAEYYAELCDQYPIVSIEDGMAENDWDGWVALTDALGDRVQLVGDDLFVTNPERLRARASSAASPTRSSSRSTRSAR